MRLQGEKEMKRCIVKFNGKESCNIEADMLCREEGIVFAYKGTDLVGVFDLGFVDAIILSTSKGGSET
jgi:hypothetical protein